MGWFILAGRKKSEKLPEGEKKKGMALFYTGCIIWLEVFRRRFQYRIKGERLEQLKKVYVGKNEEDIFYLYYGKMCSRLCVVFLCGLLMISVSGLYPKEGKLKGGYLLEREGALGEDQTVKVSADAGEEKREISIPVPKRQYTKKQLRQKFKEAKDFVKQQYLGDNPSVDKISGPLNLVKHIPGSAVSVKWHLGNDGLVGGDGSVINEDLEENTQTEVIVEFSYGEEKESMAIMLTILPRQKTKEEQYWKKWQEGLELNQEKTRTKQYLKLPDNIAGKQVKYSEEGIPLTYAVTGIVLFLPIILIFLMEENLKKKIIKREKELRADYPEFVEQFVLLIGAGLNIRGAWQKITEDYVRVGKQKRYVHEEMLVSVRDMEHGMSEARAYELFGKRTGLLQYMKFCTLIVQNLRKGSDDLLRVLDYEAADAFRERKENAKALGEEAGTKLLLPMMLMLVVVFALILYAAFNNM